ncbi:hypothetical protein BGZ98_006043 [Dissophora globulifera]|nr:hypothetical protein BGZ98_006043 [Dissophora globulifera]
MTMMTDRVYLVASMEYLISQFQVIAFNLQSTANAICPQQQSPATRSMSYSSSHHRRSIMPESAPTKRGRPLTDVLAKPDIFVQLHAAFVSFDYATQESKHEKQQQQTQPQTLTLTQGGGAGAQGARIDSLRELRRVLGRRQFDKLVWNTLVGNQVIVRGGETRIVHDIIRVLEEVLPKDCCTVILDGSSYEPSYACNILGLDRHIPIPPDLYPEDFILLDIWLDYSGRHQIPTPPPSLPALDASQRAGSGAMTTPPPIYQADWSSATLVADMKDLATRLEKTVIASSESNTNGNNHDHRQAEDTTAAAVVGRSPPISSPGALYPSSTGVEPRPERMYLLQAGEEPPVEFKMNFEGEIGLQDSIGRRAGAGAGVGPGAILQMSYQQDCRLFIETVNEILDYKLPRKIETKRLELMLEEWISKSIQFHNLYKAGKASDEAVVDKFLQSMRVDRQDLKILRFFTRCAKSSAFQAQKYRSEDAGVLSTGATSQPSSIPSVAAAMMTTTTTTATTLTVTAATTTASIAATTAMATTASST